MSKHHVDTHQNQFSCRKQESIADAYKPEQILQPLSNFLFGLRQENLKFNYSYDLKNDRIKAEKVILLANIEKASNN